MAFLFISLVQLFNSMNFAIRPNEARAYSRLLSYYFATVCRDVNTTLAVLRGGNLPLFCLALSNTDYSVDCVQITLSAILIGVAPFQSIQFQLCGFHKWHALLTAFNCLNLFTLFSFMAFRVFGCPFAVVNKIPIQRVGFSFRRRLFSLMAFRRTSALASFAIVGGNNILYVLPPDSCLLG